MNPPPEDPRWAAPRGAVSIMRSWPEPWGVAGGWALDLLRGEVTRDHADVEVAIFRFTSETLALEVEALCHTGQDDQAHKLVDRHLSPQDAAAVLNRRCSH